ncbi:MaoC family dehydratase [Rhizobium leguminosarum]|uniref:MaoC family dehydratase n=1 Tax=Rhizobium leguminosarum TaxID=384 RepID=UPI001C964523|nr:MaoC family dehydratase [Rhizobium leguminosarum]MBY5775288.1 MaoC family dehydratase [Rhizobium leguminosarum]
MRNNLFHEDFEPGTIFQHDLRKTVTEAEHILFCLLSHNTHPIHMDAHFAKSATRHGKILVVSSYLFSVLLGMSEDIMKNAAKHLQFDQLRHVAPVFHGDTIRGESQVVQREAVNPGRSTGVITLETRGYKQDDTLVLSFLHSVAIRSSATAVMADSHGA